MKNWDTDKILGAGLIVALIFYFIVVLIIALFNKELLPLDVASNIITGLIGFMGKTLIDKHRIPPENEHDAKK